jgi:hypothetical protein
LRSPAHDFVEQDLGKLVPLHSATVSENRVVILHKLMVFADD